MIFFNLILFKYYENFRICYILYYLDIHQKEMKSIQPLFLNPGAQILFVARSDILDKEYYEKKSQYFYNFLDIATVKLFEVFLQFFCST